MVLKMIIIVKDDSFMDIADIPNHYEREPKKIVVESQQDLLEAKKLKILLAYTCVVWMKLKKLICLSSKKLKR